MPVTFYSPTSVGARPFGNERTNPEGSPYLALSPTELAAISTSDLNRFIFDTIFDTSNEGYFDSLKLQMMVEEPIRVTDDVFSWDEMPDQRTAIIIDNGVAAAGTQLTAATAAVPGGYATVTVPVTAATLAYVGINFVLAFSATQQAVVTSKPTATTMVLTSLVGEGIPAIIQGDGLVVMGESIGDAGDGWKNVQRPNKLQRSNYLASFRRALKYGRKELIKLENNSRNNNLEMDRKSVFTDLKYDALVNMWIGRKGVRRLDDGNYAKGMDGIHTQMVQGAATFSPTTFANLPAAFELLAHNTNFQSTGGTRTIYARQELLTIMSKAYKELHIRYKPEDMKANMDLEAIRVGGQTYRFCPFEPLGDRNYFPASMANNMYVIDDASLKPVVHADSRLPMYDMGGLLAAKRSDYRGVGQNVADNIKRQDYTVRDCELNFSLRMKDPKRSFCLTAG